MSKNLSEDHPDKRAAANEFGTRQLFRRPAMPARKAVLFIKVFGDQQVITSGDGKFIFAISEDMDGLSLVAIESYVSTVSGSGSVSVSLYNLTQARDLLTGNVIIDPLELTSCTSVFSPAIHATNSQVDHCDLLEINVDSAGSNALGLGVMLTFGLPAA